MRLRVSEAGYVMDAPTKVTLTILTAFVIVVLLLVWFAFPRMDYVPPSIANVTVPSGLHCAEDDTIFWVGIDTLGCVHWENVR